jgi:glucokinase
MLENRFHIHTMLENDANACALAEWKYGAGKGLRNVVFLTFGTGLGAGLIMDGRLYRGTNDMAGEAGHIRLESHGPVGYGKSGSFEGFCSGGGIAQLAAVKALEKLQTGGTTSFCRNIQDLGGISAKSAALAARAGDETAIETYRTVGDYLGRGLSILIDLLNPEMIILGSIFFRDRVLMQEQMEKTIQEETLFLNRNVCRIVTAALGEQLGDYGALAVALDGLDGSDE